MANMQSRPVGRAHRDWGRGTASAFSQAVSEYSKLLAEEMQRIKEEEETDLIEPEHVKEAAKRLLADHS